MRGEKMNKTPHKKQETKTKETTATTTTTKET
jgi:hypothetical protein